MVTTLNPREIYEVIRWDPIVYMDSMFSGGAQKTINLFRKFYENRKKMKKKEK